MLSQLPQLPLILPNALALAPAPHHRSQPLQRGQEMSFTNVVTRTVDVHGRHLMKDLVTEDDDEEMFVQNDSFKFVNVHSRVPGRFAMKQF